MKDIIVNGEAYFYEEQMCTSSPMNINDANELLLLVHKLFNENNLNFMLIFGTLLGAVRDSKLINTDTDIDIVVDIEQEKLLISLIPILEINSIKLFRHTSGYLYSFRYKSCYIDVCIMSKMGFFLCRNRYIRIFHYITPSHLLIGEEKICFLGQSFSVPKNPINLLKFWYGDTWNIPVSGEKFYYEIKIACLFHYLKDFWFYHITLPFSKSWRLFNIFKS